MSNRFESYQCAGVVFALGLHALLGSSEIVGVHVPDELHRSVPDFEARGAGAVSCKSPIV